MMHRNNGNDNGNGNHNKDKRKDRIFKINLKGFTAVQLAKKGLKAGLRLLTKKDDDGERLDARTGGNFRAEEDAFYLTTDPSTSNACTRSYEGRYDNKLARFSLRYDKETMSFISEEYVESVTLKHQRAQNQNSTQTQLHNVSNGIQTQERHIPIEHSSSLQPRLQPHNQVRDIPITKSTVTSHKESGKAATYSVPGTGNFKEKTPVEPEQSVNAVVENEESTDAFFEDVFNAEETLVEAIEPPTDDVDAFFGIGDGNSPTEVEAMDVEEPLVVATSPVRYSLPNEDLNGTIGDPLPAIATAGPLYSPSPAKPPSPTHSNNPVSGLSDLFSDDKPDDDLLVNSQFNSPGLEYPKYKSVESDKKSTQQASVTFITSHTPTQPLDKVIDKCNSPSSPAKTFSKPTGKSGPLKKKRAKDYLPTATSSSGSGSDSSSSGSSSSDSSSDSSSGSSSESDSEAEHPKKKVATKRRIKAKNSPKILSRKMSAISQPVFSDNEDQGTLGDIEPVASISPVRAFSGLNSPTSAGENDMFDDLFEEVAPQPDAFHQDGSAFSPAHSGNGSPKDGRAFLPTTDDEADFQSVGSASPKKSPSPIQVSKVTPPCSLSIERNNPAKDIHSDNDEVSSDNQVVGDINAFLPSSDDEDD